MNPYAIDPSVGASHGMLRVLPVYLVVIALEALYLWRRRQVYNWGESAASFGVAVGHFASVALGGAVTLAVATFAYQHRVFTVAMDSPWSWVGLFVGVEFLYYWYHRWSHEVRWLWASHSVHHTPNEFNFSAAYRLAWTSTLTGAYLFFMPLEVLGFPPWSVFLMLGINLSYQFWLHTELAPKLGFLEKILNTPSHHRVHHAANVEYLDANYGGVVIVFDRLFGTLIDEAQEIPCRFGLVHPLTTRNPLRIALGEWVTLVRDVVGARRWSDAWRFAFGVPGWSPDGSRQTTAMLRAEFAARRAGQGQPAVFTLPPPVPAPGLPQRPHRSATST